jgi:TPR repeat protein
MKPETELRVSRYSLRFLTVIQIVVYVVVAIVLLGYLVERYGQHQYKQGLDAFEHKDYAVAYRSLKSATYESGGLAEYYLGVMNRDGLGMSRNSTQAVLWFEKALNAGVASGGTSLAAIYADPDSPLHDESKATSYYRKAADAGSVIAMRLAAFRLFKGNGTNIDQPAGYFYLHRAALQGDRSAQYYLGVVTAQGKGTPKDMIESFAWIEIAAERGEPDADAVLQSVKAKLGDAEIEKAVARTAELKAKLGPKGL